MSRFVTTGAQGGAANRLEINDLVKIEDQFSLYIQALSAMYAVDQNDQLSFFQIGGIHGLPYIPWGESGGESQGSWGGYCTHGTMIFPTWHRPYIALFEQLLQRHAIAIANTYIVDRPRWQKAAADLRAPYWDWAVNSVPPDEVISLRNVTIIRPDGRRASVPNPLFEYTFHPIDNSFPSPWSGWRTTLRQPTSAGSGATSDVARLRRVLAAEQEDITSKTIRMLAFVHTWPAFSNHTVGDGGSASNSVEAIHDEIHVDIGGSRGHMSTTLVAGFDPIFFLHHANVDRLMSLWSALNPGVWVTPGPAGTGTWTIPDNAAINDQTELTPFLQTQQSYWTSAGTASTERLGYTYPEFNGLDMNNPTAVRTAIATIVNRLYGGSAFSALSQAAFTEQAASFSAKSDSNSSNTSSSRNPGQTPTGGDGNGNGDRHSGAPSPANPVGTVGGGNSIDDWSVRVRVKQYALGESFSVLIFLGGVPNSEDRRSSATYVGAYHIFVNPSVEHCENCRRQAEEELVVEGFVHLNNAVARCSGLGSFDPSVVEPYLKDKLVWQVERTDGTRVNPDEVPSLEVTVCDRPLTLEPGEIFPVPGEVRYCHDITRGRAGGHRLE